MRNDYGDTKERPILRTGSLWRPLYALRKAFGKGSIRPTCERHTTAGVMVDYAVLGRG